MEKKPGKKEFRLPSDLAEVQKASAKVLEFLKPLSLGEGCLFDVRLCLEEALINAMKYGNRLKKEIPVRLEVEVDGGELRLTVEDQGEGFDVARLKDCTKKDNLLRNSGRGVYLIHQLMDRVQYNSKGNCLVMAKKLPSHAGKH
ncbi:MAG TPA: ATP-binding protein [Candidatus Eisenbacteria bacterium]|jgi:serine/threonine-protein kinase RsbW|nr:ATP-binding protein [Candidatus Eisenbacteria bacterium]